ncbi:MAG: sel1 repeat family protein, partial [Erysipelotrichaceae bacterium]|nr:sel1 repeat family protein [Erysipelotrichaceae bacterium]
MFWKKKEPITLEQRFGKSSLKLLKDMKAAIQEMEELEALGYAEAGILLGQHYYQNPELATKHFQIAADAGIAEGYWGLCSHIYHAYILDETDENELLWEKYCIKAAEGGCVDAMNELGNIYQRKNQYLKALYWYQFGACCGFKEATYGLAPVFNRWLMAGRPTECPKGFNSIQHQIIMCICQIYGKDFTQNPVDRLKELAAEEGGALAGLFLGNRFLQNREYRSAAKMFTCAYENHCARAAYELYLLYENGQGVGMDRIASKKYLEAAARMGDAFSMNEYGKE